VEIVQICILNKAFIIDINSLCRTVIDDNQTKEIHKINLNENEFKLNNCLLKLFNSINFTIIGYGILEDLSRLVTSYTHMSCLYQYKQVIDIKELSNNVELIKQYKSLSNLCLYYFRKKMNKACQCSTWHLRPLSQDQVQ
jgi:hypothetical protein